MLLGIAWICLGLSLIVGLVSRSVLMRAAATVKDVYLLAEAPYALLLVGVGCLVAFGWRNIIAT